ncbi:hypothetical protein [Balneatrix alpica]|uniref:WGR domain-containing protein n=1 Tax=Balneatrix alpica TaxID=75684 RepID=A0ABV5Z6L7_9GAMM|nr:hypothetical protein [Balneatrix alpica]
MRCKWCKADAEVELDLHQDLLGDWWVQVSWRWLGRKKPRVEQHFFASQESAWDHIALWGRQLKAEGFKRAQSAEWQIELPLSSTNCLSDIN